jgi:hypothetical protein
MMILALVLLLRYVQAQDLLPTTSYPPQAEVTGVNLPTTSLPVTTSFSDGIPPVQSTTTNAQPGTTGVSKVFHYYAHAV